MEIVDAIVRTLIAVLIIGAKESWRGKERTDDSASRQGSKNGRGHKAAVAQSVFFDAGAIIRWGLYFR